MGFVEVNHKFYQVDQLLSEQVRFDDPIARPADQRVHKLARYK